MTQHKGHSYIWQRPSTQLTDSDKREIMNSITLDHAPIHSEIISLMRIRGIALTSQDVINVINSFDNEFINVLELQLRDSEFISAPGQFPSLIKNLSSDDEQIVFV
jgi:seryl-tRNA(Sec) selenium transferase